MSLCGFWLQKCSALLLPQLGHQLSQGLSCQPRGLEGRVRIGEMRVLITHRKVIVIRQLIQLLIYLIYFYIVYFTLHALMCVSSSCGNRVTRRE